MSDACPYCRRELGLVIRTADREPLHEITLPGQVPGGSKYNTCYDPKLKMVVPRRKKNTRTGRYDTPTSFEKWVHELDQLQRGRMLVPPKSPAPWPVICEVEYYPGDHRRRDADNLLAPLFNYLQQRRVKIGRVFRTLPGTGWVVDDKQLIPVWRPQPVDRENPRAVIRLWRTA